MPHKKECKFSNVDEKVSDGRILVAEMLLLFHFLQNKRFCYRAVGANIDKGKS